jgi:UDPglucose 6-dehydrogenase
LAADAKVSAFDPAVKNLPKELGKISLANEIGSALENADAAVICTEWPQFRQADWPKMVSLMRGKIFVDANRFLEKELKNIGGVEHLSVGRA